MNTLSVLRSWGKTMRGAVGKGGKGAVHLPKILVSSAHARGAASTAGQANLSLRSAARAREGGEGTFGKSKGGTATRS